MSDMKWLNVSAGISEILLVPMGNCTCGTIDVPENSSPLEYFIAGNNSGIFYLINVLMSDLVKFKDQYVLVTKQIHYLMLKLWKIMAKRENIMFLGITIWLIIPNQPC